MRFSFFGGQACETHNSKEIADFAQVRRCPIQLDQSFFRCAVDHVGFETLPVLQIANQDFLVSEKSHHFGYVSGDGQAAFII
jgi:hypothetical protein